MAAVATGQWGEILGEHVRVHRSTAMGFDHPAAMLLEHFDTPAYAGTTFVLGDNVFHPVAHFRGLYPDSRIVVYQLEQMVGSKTWHPVERIIEYLRGADAVWDYDRLNAHYLSWYGVAVDRVVPMLYARSLERVVLQEQPRIDVLFTGFINDRRHRILQSLQQRLYRHRVRFMWLQGVEGADLDHYVGDARIVLNLHAFEPWHRQEQTRIFYPLINGRMVVSEASEANWFGDCIVEADPDNLADALLHWLENDRWRAFGLQARERFRAQTERWLDRQDDPVPARVMAGVEAEPGITPSPVSWHRVVGALRVHKAHARKVRLGGPADGGYVVPRVVLDRCTALISIGINVDSEFEEDWFARTGRPVDMYDGSWPCPAICRRWPEEVGGSLRYIQRDVGRHDGMIPLSEVIAGKDGALLKIDAEGAEYGLLADTNLSHLNALVLEVHDLLRPDDRRRLVATMDRLAEHFVLVHVHGNAHAGTAPLPPDLRGDGDDFPSVLELTLVHRRIHPGPVEPDDERYPIPGLDASNKPGTADVRLGWVNRR